MTKTMKSMTLIKTSHSALINQLSTNLVLITLVCGDCKTKMILKAWISMLIEQFKVEISGKRKRLHKKIGLALFCRKRMERK